MSNTKWNKGPPPSLGWWPASSVRDPDMHRWWNGSDWSVAVARRRTPEEASSLAMYRREQARIEWRARPKTWPARSFT